MKYIALLLLTSTSGHKLIQTNAAHSHSHLRAHLRARYDEAEGPTKADFGDSDPSVVFREEDVNEKKEKKSGWTNPLGWSDDGMDDDKILNMRFVPLDEEYRMYNIPMYSHDQDVIETMESERQAIAEVKKRQEANPEETKQKENLKKEVAAEAKAANK